MRLWPRRRTSSAADRAAILEAHARHEAAEAEAARQRILTESHKWNDQTQIHPIITLGQELSYRRPGTPQ
jgi:hypothetical protein